MSVILPGRDCRDALNELNPIELVDETDAKAERLEKLAAFQLQMILHAFRCMIVWPLAFTRSADSRCAVPAARRLVYSTCSIYAEEDERVVMKALTANQGWRLAPMDSVLPSWQRRGRVEEMGGDQSGPLSKEHRVES